MQKELNQELFGSGPVGQSRFKENETTNNYRAAQQTEQKITEVKQGLHGLAEQMASLVSQVNEYIKVSHNRLEKFQAQLKASESRSEAFKQEVNQKFSLVHQRLNERKSMEMKMQDLMDRHNSVLRTYEVRMNQLQKLIAEKDAQIAISQSTLNEAKMEIARLKRL